MQGLSGRRLGLCTLAGAVTVCLLQLESAAFSSLPLQRGPASAGRALKVSQQRVEGAQDGAAWSFCNAAILTAVAGICARGIRVAMQSQGQGGRFNLGQYFMPKLKGAKKLAVLRPRKNYGSSSARQVPRRYPLYDILEEIDEKIPMFTVISEPEEPLPPVEDVPLLQRYPWAGSLEKVPLKKQKMEEGETKLEPYFGSWTRQNLPPLGRRQRYVHRRGVPSYNHPPWINRPLIGEGVKVPGDLPYQKDRRPQEWQFTERQRKAMQAQQAKMEKAKDEVMGEMDDDLDAELDAMGGKR